MLTDHALYQVTLKALLLKDNRLLTLITPDGYLDFPGGRVDESERGLGWEDSLRREAREELGGNIAFDVGETAFVAKRQYTFERKTYYVAAIFFACQFRGGEITLSDEHSRFAWLEPAELIRGDYKYVSEDERQRLRAYFAFSKSAMLDT